MAGMNDNVFQRYAYSPRYQIKGEDPKRFEADNNLVVFSGGDLTAYINNIKVSNLESVTWSTSVEVAGNYVMGRRNAVTYTKGKRVVVGSMVLSQYDKHALIEHVFHVSERGISTIGGLWNPSTNVGNALATGNRAFTAPGGVGTTTYIEKDQNVLGTDVIQGNNYLNRGLSREAFERQLQQQYAETAQLVGAQKFNYSDQIPPFDLTLVGVTQSGDAARCSLFGITVTQETGGFSQNDLGNSVGMSFVALAVSPWRPIVLDGTKGNIVAPAGA